MESCVLQHLFTFEWICSDMVYKKNPTVHLWKHLNLHLLLKGNVDLDVDLEDHILYLDMTCMIDHF